jgi:hypothetical protein
LHQRETGRQSLSSTTISDGVMSAGNSNPSLTLDANWTEANLRRHQAMDFLTQELQVDGLGDEAVDSASLERLADLI